MSEAPIIINPKAVAKRSIIWLHGLGADGYDFVPIAKELALPENLGVRYVFPNAPAIPVSINGGYVMPAWYDISVQDLQAEVDVDGILQSARYLLELVEAERRSGIDYHNILLAGFSQGGVIALAAGLRCPHRLAGIMALSTYLPLEVEAPGQFDLDVFIGHGTQDNVVPCSAARDARARLEQVGHRVTAHEYAMAHSVNLHEIEDIRHWLLGLFSA